MAMTTMPMRSRAEDGEDRAWGGGPIEPAELFEHSYDRLRALAQRHFRGQAAVTLQPTALVHEAFLRLARNPLSSFHDQEHFLATVTRVMRQIAVDRARRRAAGKRGGGRQRVELTDAIDEPGASDRASIDVLAVNDLLTRLAELSPRQARVVELRVFVELTVGEIAAALRVSVATVESDWRAARAWMRVELGRADTASAAA